jgi:hypothetical protein
MDSVTKASVEKSRAERNESRSGMTTVAMVAAMGREMKFRFAA